MDLHQRRSKTSLSAEEASNILAASSSSTSNNQSFGDEPTVRRLSSSNNTTTNRKSIIGRMLGMITRKDDTSVHYISTEKQGLDNGGMSTPSVSLPAGTRRRTKVLVYWVGLIAVIAGTGFLLKEWSDTRNRPYQWPPEPNWRWSLSAADLEWVETHESILEDIHLGKKPQTGQKNRPKPTPAAVNLEKVAPKPIEKPKVTKPKVETGWLQEDHNKDCGDWNPKLETSEEANDPPKCLKAKQYRQVQKVLDRERKAKHPHWYFTKTHNIETLKKLQMCFLPTSDPEYTECPPKPLIVDGWWYTALVVQKLTSGETIWMTSLTKQVEELGMFWIAVGPYENWVETAEMLRDVYRFIWAPDVDVVSCITDPRCIAKEHYTPPDGAEDLSIDVPDEERGIIPIWAINIVDYWGCRPRSISNNNYWWGLKHNNDFSYHSLGHKWIATPWPLPADHVYLPYSIEEFCLDLPVLKPEERDDQVLLLAKRSTYFDYSWNSPKDFWSRLAAEDGINLLTTANIEEGHPLPEGLNHTKGMSRAKYELLVSKSKALLGIGAPPQSPSVYSALCAGTPVIMPHFSKTINLTGWETFTAQAQHGPAMTIGEPYVYSYYAQDYDQLLSVTRKAIATPIERYIPDDMRYTYAIKEMEKYLKRDLIAMFNEVIEENGGKVPALEKGLRESCYKLNRCRKPQPAGRKPSID